MDKLDNKRLDALYNAVLSLKTKEECKSFFIDICTVKEMNDLAQRLEVAALLTEKVSYQEISKITGASTATISRVSRALNYGPGGYKTVLDATKENGND